MQSWEAYNDGSHTDVALYGQPFGALSTVLGSSILLPFQALDVV